MSNPHQPREIDISRARVRRTAQPIQPVNRSAPTPPAEQRVARPQQQTTPPPRRTAPQQAQPRRRAPENTNAQPRRRMPSEKDRRKKKNPWKTALKVLCILLLVFGGIYFGLRLYAGAITTTGDMGTLDKTQVLGTPPEFKGKQLNLLVLGIDYTTEDAEIVQRDPIGNTDMLLYCQFDFEKDTMKMLQIPRDTFVGEIGGKAGKINGVFANSADPDNRVSTVASLVSQQLNL
ncbi:MAG: hypothetical protein RSD01_05550, partial [Ruthenibacterium sp.]